MSGNSERMDGFQLIVAGFHRSGTSLVCQMLQRAGLFLGYDLLGANPSNRYGHFEDVEILNLHERILADNGKTWQSGEAFVPTITDAHWNEIRRIIERRNAEHELWGFKDPRVCMFLPVWKHSLPKAKVLIVYRHFSDSTHSLSRRQSAELFSGRGSWEQVGRLWEEPDLALRMWLVHNEALLSFARACPEDTMTVSLEMIHRGFPLVGAISDRWDLGLDETLASEVFDPNATTARRARQPVSDRRLIPRVENVWRELERSSEATKRLVTGGGSIAGR